MKRILVLGAGLVAKPLVHYLMDKGHEVTVASRTVSRAAKLVSGHPNGRALELDVQDERKLAELIRGCDLAVSLFPPQFHPVVARLCIAARKNMVTTSYVSPAMQELDGPAKSAGVTVLNEIGVDPGGQAAQSGRLRQKALPSRTRRAWYSLKRAVSGGSASMKTSRSSS